MADNFDRIQALMDAGRHQEAAQACADALAQEPGHPVALCYLAFCQAYMGQKKESVRTAEAAIAAAPDYFLAWNALTVAKLGSGKHKEAEKAARKALDLEPEWPLGWYNLALCQHNQGDFRSALASAEEGLKHDPNDADLGSFRANLLARLGRSDEAHEAVLKGLSESPHTSEYHEARGVAELRTGRYKEAATAFQEALRIDPTDRSAAEGLKEALRHRILPYRIISNVIGLLDRIPPGGRTAVWIGLWLLFRFGRTAYRENPDLLPLFIPIAVLYITFFGFFWLGETLANITLLFHPMGRYALEKVESLEAWSAIAAVASAAVCFGMAVLGSPVGAAAVIACFIMLFLTGLSSNLRSMPKLRIVLAWAWIFGSISAGLASCIALVMG